MADFTPTQGRYLAFIHAYIGLHGRPPAESEIAAALFIAEQTVKTHVSKVLQKLHLRDRVHAVVLAYDTGLVQPGA